VDKQEKLLSILGRIHKDYVGFCVGFFNIESGQVAISDEIFFSCDNCNWNFRSITEKCTTCGKDGTNYIKFKSGSGDGVYSLFRFVKRGMEHGETLDDGTIDYFDNTDESIGGLIFLDWVKNGDKILPHFLNGDNGRRVELENLSAWFDINDCEGEYIGSVICKNSGYDLDQYHCLYVSDASIGKNGQDAILFANLSPGEYAIFLFESVAIFIKSDKAKQYGLIPQSRLSKIETENFALGKKGEAVRSHVTPMGPQTIMWNSELAELSMIYDLDLPSLEDFNRHTDDGNFNNPYSDYLEYFNRHTDDGNFNHPYWELFRWLVQMEHLEIDGAAERVAGFTNPNNPLLHRSALVGYLKEADADYQYWTDLKLEILESLGIIQKN
jgi:hypothetical protein